MNDYINFALTVFTGFFAICNPIANIPIFLGFVQNETIEDQRILAKKSTIIAFLILVSFLLLGKYIFEIFGLTIPAFKMTGGILIFYIGFEMLLSKAPQSKKTNVPTVFDDSIAISPLAIPLLTGPGTIVTGMNFIANADNISKMLVIFGCGALIMLLNFFAFYYSKYIIRGMGHNLIKVLGKIMGLILSIMGMAMLVEGIKLAFDLHIPV